MANNGRPLVAYLTGDLVPLNDPDLEIEQITSAFAEVGLEPVVLDWNRAEDLSGIDAVVVRSPWDYHLKFDRWREFLTMAKQSCLCINPAEVIEWNMDKRYLNDLSTAGVPTVPTTFCTDESSLTAALEAALDSPKIELIVMKPAVSAGSKDTALIAPDDPTAMTLGAKVLSGCGVVMVQPAISSVASVGEVAAVCLGDSVSHWVRKGPLLKVGGGLLSGDSYVEDISVYHPEPERVGVVNSALTSIRKLCHDRFGVHSAPTYSRLDTVIADDGEILLLEAELFEPSLFLAYDDGAAQRFAELVAERVFRGS